MTPASAYGKETEMKQAIELIDLGDAKVETRQFGVLPLCLDSIYIYGLWPW